MKSTGQTLTHPVSRQSLQRRVIVQGISLFFLPPNDAQRTADRRLSPSQRLPRNAQQFQRLRLEQRMTSEQAQTRPTQRGSSRARTDEPVVLAVRPDLANGLVSRRSGSRLTSCCSAILLRFG